MDGYLQVLESDVRQTLVLAPESDLAKRIRRYSAVRHNLAFRPPEAAWPRATSSHVSEFDSNDDANDGKMNIESSRERGGNRWTASHSMSDTDWLQIEFEEETEFGRVVLAIYDEGPQKSVQTPTRYSVEYWDGAAWKDVANPQRLPDRPQGNDFNEIEFTPIKSKKLRVVFTHGGKTADGRPYA